MSLLTPEQHPVKYYSSKDADAPQISDADLVIKTIIKACLVTGYGAKAGAGWTALHEDSNKIVLRRPLQTGNPVDVKIINGYGLYQIVSQDNPASISDAAFLAKINMIARDANCGTEWHLIASDFGFLFCYQMGRSSASDKNNILYVGSMSPLRDTGSPMLMLKNNKAADNGTAGYGVDELLGTGVSFIDMRSGAELTDKQYVSISLYPDKDFVQKLIISSYFTPFYISVASRSNDKTTEAVTIKGRPMLRWMNKMDRDTNSRALFIPLDYWEL